MDEAVVRPHPEPWNKGKLVGQKAPFKLKEIWAIRVRLQLFRRARDLALFDLGIDSKLRAPIFDLACGNIDNQLSELIGIARAFFAFKACGHWRSLRKRGSHIGF